VARLVGAAHQVVVQEAPVRLVAVVWVYGSKVLQQTEIMVVVLVLVVLVRLLQTQQRLQMEVVALRVL